MNIRRLRLLVLVVFAVGLFRPLSNRFLVPAAAAPESRVFVSASGDPLGDDDKILQVTQNLLPATQIKGRSNAMTLADRMRYYKIPGVSIAVINNGGIEWARGFGIKDASTNEPVTAETLFQAGSISKPVAATAALRLVEEGKLDLNENVNDKLKSWKVPTNQFTEKTKVTLRELLSHTAGMTVHGFPGYSAGVPVPTLVHVLDGVSPANTPAIRVDVEPGTIWRYSGGGYTVMQQLLIDLTGKPFPDILYQTVISKVGMPHSTYEQPLPRPLQSRAATAHSKGEPIKGRWHIYPEMAAAGLWTTPSDLALFAIDIQRALAGDSSRVLSPSMARMMVTPVKNNYGLGFGIEGTGDSARFGHGGVDEGFESQLTAYEKGGWGAVVMTNGSGGSALAQEVIRAIAKVYSWPGYPFIEKEALLVDPKGFNDYAGKYVLGQMTATVWRDGDRLMARGPDEMDTEFFAESGSWYFTRDEGPELKFNRDASGHVIGMTVRQYDRNFEFKRVQ